MQDGRDDLGASGRQGQQYIDADRDTVGAQHMEGVLLLLCAAAVRVCKATTICLIRSVAKCVDSIDGGRLIARK